MDIFKEFIDRNPSKILGKIEKTTDRFGNPDILVKGDFETINQIDVSDSILPSKSKSIISFKTPQFSQQEEEDRIRKSIAITQEEEKNKTLSKKPKNKPTSNKNKSAFKLIIPGDKRQDIYTFEESHSQLNKGISDDMVQVWAWYCKKRGVSLNPYAESLIPLASDAWITNQMEKGNICYDGKLNEYIPSIIYYSGNIYDKIKEISLFNTHYEKLGLQDQALRQLKQLKNIIPHPLKLTGDKEERLVLSVLSRFVKETRIIYEGEENSILEHFKNYLRNIDTQDMKYDVQPWHIINYYIDGDRMPNYWDKYEKINIKRKAAQECVIQMAVFLDEELSKSSQEEIELAWNKQNNGFVDVAFDKIPLFMEYSKYFKKSILRIRDAQREGIAFQTTNGTGIIAYDVGVGKTLTAILNVGYALQNGLCKRPLIVVPKPTYEKWINEINGYYDGDELVGSGLLPQYPIIDLYNLDKKRQKALFDKDGKFKGIPENSISICTYEGMQRIGFSEDAEASFISELKEILNQGYGDESERQKVLEDEKLNRMIGMGQENTILNIDEAGFDYFTVDEAHNFNKIFSSVKGETVGSKGRDKSNYQIRGTQSSRAVKAFFLSNYIQKNTKFGNVCLLTATPFTNNPLEVYNILALTNIKRLGEKGLKNISSFFDNYVNQTYEKVIKSTGEIVEAAVIKGWNNKISLQKILFSYMNYKSGEDANIQRPEKWTLPKLSEVVDGSVIPLSSEDQVPTYLKPTEEQKMNQKEISKWLIAQMKDPDLSKKAPYLVADIMSKKNCISPYIYNEINPFDISPKDFINSSPKLKYAMDCIKSVRDWHINDGSDISGQVLYINGGVEYLFLIKEYLIETIGYKRKAYEHKKNKYFDEIEILAGSGNFKRNDDEKEEIKELFNKGVIKVIIGTSTIREGIDLQVRSSCLYALWVDWNPTSYKQLEGRIWRFGNEFANVRIVTPLLVGSSDAFTYQKLEEKTARINDIFDRNDKSNMLDVGEEDREAVKWALVDDLSEIAKAKIRDAQQELKKEITVAQENISKINNISGQIRNADVWKDKIQNFVDVYWKYVNTDKLPEDLDLNDLMSRFTYMQQHREEIKENQGMQYGFDREMDSMTWTAKELRKAYKKLDKLQEQVKEKFGVSIYGDEIEGVKEQLEKEVEDLQEEQRIVGSEESKDKIIADLEAERKKFNSGIGNYEETLAKFTDLNYLLGDKVSEQQLPVQNKKEFKKPTPAPIKETEEVIEIEDVISPSLEDLINRRKVVELMGKKIPSAKARLKVLDLMIKKAEGTEPKKSTKPKDEKKAAKIREEIIQWANENASDWRKEYLYKTKYIKESDIQKFLDCKMPENLIKVFYLGVGVLNWHPDGELQNKDIDGIFPIMDEYIEKNIQSAINKCKNKEFEIGLKYPDFDWGKVLPGKKKRDAIITSPPHKFSNYTVFEKIAIQVYDNFVIGGVIEREYQYDSGKKEVKKYRSTNPLKQEYIGIVANNIDTFKTIIKNISEQKNGYVKDLQIMGNNIGGVSIQDIKYSKFNFEKGGAINLWEDKKKKIITETGYKDGDNEVKLLDLKKYPLSSQLQAFTGDSYNSIDFENVQDPKVWTVEPGNKIRHKKTGMIFIVPNPLDEKEKIIQYIPIKNKTTGELIKGTIRYNPQFEEFQTSIDGEPGESFKDIDDAKNFMKGAGFDEIDVLPFGIGGQIDRGLLEIKSAKKGKNTVYKTVNTTENIVFMRSEGNTPLTNAKKYAKKHRYSQLRVLNNKPEQSAKVYTL